MDEQRAPRGALTQGWSEVSRGALAGAVLGSFDVLPLAVGPRGVERLLLGLCATACFGAWGGAVASLVSELERMPRWLDKMLGWVALPAVPVGLLLVTVLESAPVRVSAVYGCWLIGTLSLCFAIARRRFTGLGPWALVVGLVTCMALVQLGVPSRVATVYWHVALATAVVAWGLQVLAAVCGASLQAVKDWARWPWGRAGFLIVALVLAYVGTRVVAERHAGLRWLLVMTAWLVARVALRAVSPAVTRAALWIVLPTQFTFALALHRSIERGLPLVGSEKGARLVGDLMAALQDPAQRLARLQATVRQHPSYQRAFAEYSKPREQGPSQPSGGSSPASTIVLVTIDSFPYRLAGYAGGEPPGLTPHLDELAEQSVRFHDAHAPATCTLLSLPAVLHSRFPGELPWRLAYGDEEYRLLTTKPASIARSELLVTWPVIREPQPDHLASLLSVAGYSTHAILNGGRTHIFDSEAGFERGFQGADLFGGSTAVETVDNVSDDRVGDAFDRLLSRSPGDRLFVWVHLFTPHAPNVHPRPGDPFSGYRADLHATDRVLGRLIETMHRAGRYQNSLIAVIGDHGESFGDHGYGAPDVGIHGMSLSEAESRVPLLLKVPGVTGVDVSVLASGLDLAPTILRQVGMSVPRSYRGEDLLLLAKAPVREKSLFIEQWLIAASGRGFGLRLIGSISDQTRHKVVYNERHGTILLYDLRTDPGELNNRFDESDLQYDGADAEALAELLGWRAGILERNPHSLDRLFD